LKLLIMLPVQKLDKLVPEIILSLVILIYGLSGN